MILGGGRDSEKVVLKVLEMSLMPNTITKYQKDENTLQKMEEADIS